MKQVPSRLIHAAISLFFLSSSSGCSLIFVKTPANDGSVSSRSSGGDCTSSRLAPALDTVVGALQLVRTGMAASASDSVYENPDAPLSREADIALGAGFMALFVGSAIYGFAHTNQCSRLKHSTEADRVTPPNPAESWTSSSPPTRPSPASSSSPAAPATNPPAPPPPPASESPAAADVPLPPPGEGEEPPIPTEVAP